ncbi:MAG: hypothetical protein ACLQU3_06750 [Limisphaerales bacterium]
MSTSKTSPYMKQTSLRMIDLAISTVYRPENYLHELIERLPKATPIRLIVGSPNYGYLERYRLNSYIEIIGVDPTDWERFKDYTVLHRASWNYWRCLACGVRRGRRKGLLILEDDVLPAEGWEDCYEKVIEQIEAQYGEEFVLSLYTSNTILFESGAADRCYTRYPPPFFGTQAMYYPEPIRVAFAEHLKHEGVDSFLKHYDGVLRDYVAVTGIPLFVTTPILFQHIGEVSTGCSEDFHFARSFARKTAYTRRHK